MEQFAGNHEVSSVQRIPDFDFFGFIGLLSWENLSCSSRFRMNYETTCHASWLAYGTDMVNIQKTAHSNCFIVFIPDDVHRYQRDFLVRNRISNTWRSWQIPRGGSSTRGGLSSSVKVPKRWKLIRCHSTPPKIRVVQWPHVRFLHAATVPFHFFLDGVSVTD